MILLSFVGLTFFKTVKAKPRDEFWIALAGPMVNLGIAVATAPFIAVALADRTAPPLITQAGMATFAGFMAWLSMLNFAVAAINLMPGWPADGARAIRGWLAKKWGYGAATVRAVAISHGFWLILAGVGVIIMVLAPMIRWTAGDAPSRSPASLIVMYNILLIVFAMMGLYYGWAEKRRVARLGAERASAVVGPPPEFMPGRRKDTKTIDVEKQGPDSSAEVSAKAEAQARADGSSEGSSSTDQHDAGMEDLKTKAKDTINAGKAMWTVAKASGKGAGWFAKKSTRVISALLASEKENKPAPDKSASGEGGSK
jgi:Zn-dependent protease